MSAQRIPLQQPSSGNQDYVETSDLISNKGVLKRESTSSFINDPLKTESNLLVPKQTPEVDAISEFFNNLELKKIENWVSDVYHKRGQWQNIDYRTAKTLTNWKKQYILTIEDLRLRSVMMGVSAAVMYKVISVRTLSSFGRVRNLGISFAIMGMTFTPELFNPFLKRK